MPRRPATITQADVARLIRAARAAGVSIARIVLLADRVEIVAGDASQPGAVTVEREKEVIL